MLYFHSQKHKRGYQKSCPKTILSNCPIQLKNCNSEPFCFLTNFVSLRREHTVDVYRYKTIESIWKYICKSYKVILYRFYSFVPISINSAYVNKLKGIFSKPSGNLIDATIVLFIEFYRLLILAACSFFTFAYLCQVWARLVQSNSNLAELNKIWKKTTSS